MRLNMWIICNQQPASADLWWIPTRFGLWWIPTNQHVDSQKIHEILATELLAKGVFISHDEAPAEKSSESYTVDSPQQVFGV